MLVFEQVKVAVGSASLSTHLYFGMHMQTDRLEKMLSLHLNLCTNSGNAYVKVAESKTVGMSLFFPSVLFMILCTICTVCVMHAVIAGFYYKTTGSQQRDR